MHGKTIHLCHTFAGLDGLRGKCCCEVLLLGIKRGDGIRREDKLPCPFLCGFCDAGCICAKKSQKFPREKKRKEGKHDDQQTV